MSRKKKKSGKPVDKLSAKDVVNLIAAIIQMVTYLLILIKHLTEW